MNRIDPGLELELDDTDRTRWLALSEKAKEFAASPRPCGGNKELGREAESLAGSRLEPCLRLWMADNFMREGRATEAARAYDAARSVSERVETIHPSLDLARTAFHHLPAALARSGDVAGALRLYKSAGPDDAEMRLEGGEIAERTGDLEAARVLYEGVAVGQESRDTDEPDQLARRALERLDDPAACFFPSAEAVADWVRSGLEGRAHADLGELLSRTHFAVGPLGGHLAFETEEERHVLLSERLPGRIRCTRTLLGTGRTRYLVTRGWKGEHYRGTVYQVLTKTPRGWQWTGAVVTQVTDYWRERWRPATKQTNQPLPFPILAPWPEGERFMAGGLAQFIAKSGAVAAALFIPIFGPGIAAAMAVGFSLLDCGYGTRGFYYNEGPTHDDEDAFAIDFTRYRRGVPFANESGGTSVLVPADGMVVTACGGRTSGDPSGSNTVEILHADPAGGTGFLSRYMHLQGPGRIPLSAGMSTFTGERLGFMNDTGNSALDHLHFSIHNQSVAFPGAGSTCGGPVRGASVRPSPMDGQTLGDGDSGKCVRSSNERTIVIRLPPGCGDTIRDIIRGAFGG